jgi:hypothetical protein
LAIWMLAVGLIYGCMFRQNKGVAEGVVGQRMTLAPARIESGPVADALQWKKAAVFAVGDPRQDDFIEWLCEAREGLDPVQSGIWMGSAEAPGDLYVLFGWSPSGADELRRATLDSVIVKENEIRVYISRPELQVETALMGTSDMRFIGWRIPLLGLTPGKYAAFLHIKRDVIRIKAPDYAGGHGSEEVLSSAGYAQAAALEFQMP